VDRPLALIDHDALDQAVPVEPGCRSVKIIDRERRGMTGTTGVLMWMTASAARPPSQARGARYFFADERISLGPASQGARPA